MRYYIADLHFFHNGLNNRMDHRGFSTLETMHQHMIDRWNYRVRRNDEVIILGDFSIGKAKETEEILKQLNGKKYLITGNHDKFLQDKEFDTSLFKWIKPYAELSDNKRKVILCHYPIMCYNGQFRRNEEQIPTTWMLHGHIHNTPDCVTVEAYKDFVRQYPRASRQCDGPIPAPVQMINCFCMASDYIPLTLDEWIELENKGLLKDMVREEWKYDK